MSDMKNRLIAMGLCSAVALSGALLVAPHEGKVNNVYLDPANILTSCYGHTGPELKIGMQFTDEQCLQQLAADLAAHNQILRSVVKVPLSEGEYAAYLSFLYNVGPGKYGVKDGFVFLRSGRMSSMLRLLNAGQRVAACKQLQYWTTATVNGERSQLNGLVRRRNAEMKICLKDLR